MARAWRAEGSQGLGRLAHGVRKAPRGLDGPRMACGRFPKAWMARAWRAEGSQGLGRLAHGVRKVSKSLDGSRMACGRFPGAWMARASAAWDFEQEINFK